MRSFSILLALVLVLAGFSHTGSSETATVGVGTFAYSGSPLTVAAR
jgi:hypothetical protein